MPRFFDDYSNTYLTHDSSAGRKQQRRGWKFRENFKLHYEKYMQDWRRGEMGLASAQQAFIRARGVDDPAVTPLPDGWKEIVDDVTSITYYINTKTGKRTWVRPGFIPPPPGKGPPHMRGPGGPPRHGVGGPPPQMNLGGPPNPNFRVPPPSVGSLPPPLNANNFQQQGLPGYGQQQFSNQNRGPPLPIGNLPPPPPQHQSGY